MKELTKKQAQEVNDKIVELVKAELLKTGFTESEIQEKLSLESDSTCCPYGSGGTCVVGV